MKAAKCFNCLILADIKVQMLAYRFPVSGVYHDLYEIEVVFKGLCDLLKQANIEIEGLFLNADARFDSQTFKNLCAEMKIEANIAANPKDNTDQNYN